MSDLQQMQELRRLPPALSVLIAYVPVQNVLEVRSGLVVLRRGAERSVMLISTGLLGYALDKAKASMKP